MSVYFNAVASPSDGTMDKTAVVADGTTAEREFVGQGSNGGSAEFVGWQESGGPSPNVLPSGTSVVLQRKVDNDDDESWVAVATITNATSRIVDVFPNGRYRAVVGGFTAAFKVLLQGV